MKNSIDKLPATWALVAVQGKRPIGKDWQKNGHERSAIAEKIATNQATGTGLLLGPISGGLIATDCDGEWGHDRLIEILAGEIPRTVAFTSGKPGRAQYLFSVPETHWENLQTTKEQAPEGHPLDSDGKQEALEFRWKGSQSVIPPSIHPDTKEPYQWLESPGDCPIAPIPDALLNHWLSECQNKRAPYQPAPSRTTSSNFVSLLVLVSKTHRQEIENGVADGGRNTTGASISRDLIGCENWLHGQGFTPMENAEYLFLGFCDQCQPPIDDGERKTIWESAMRSNPSPSTPIKSLEKTLSYIQASRPQRGGESGLAVDEPSDEDVADMRAELASAMDTANTSAPLLFGGDLGYELGLLAGSFNCSVSILEFALLPILASCINPAAGLLINIGNIHRQVPVLWFGIVGDSGTKKSPILNSLLKPLKKLQSEIFEKYKADSDVYDQEYKRYKASPKDMEEPDKPAPAKDLYFSDFTIESISQSVARYPDQGQVIYNDELAGFFKSMDAYRNGKGADRQKWLEIYGGDGIKVNRKSTETIFCERSSISILGGIQPEILSKHIGGDDSVADGLYARFAFLRLPEARTKAFTPQPGTLWERLEKLYRGIQQQGADADKPLTLCPNTEPIWEAWHDETEDRKISEPRPLVKALLSKFQGTAGRVALILHRTEAAIAGHTPAEKISPETITRAIHWTRWLLDQNLYLYQSLGLCNDPEMAKVLKFVEKFRGQGWVKAADVCKWLSSGNKTTAQQARNLMAKVVGLGQAIDNDQPSTSQKYRIEISAVRKTGAKGAKKAESITGKDFHDTPSKVQDSRAETPEPIQGEDITTYTLHAPKKVDPEETANPDSGAQKTYTLNAPNKVQESKPLPANNPIDSPQKTYNSLGVSPNLHPEWDRQDFAPFTPSFQEIENGKPAKVPVEEIPDATEEDLLEDY